MHCYSGKRSYWSRSLPPWSAMLWRLGCIGRCWQRRLQSSCWPQRKRLRSWSLASIWWHDCWPAWTPSSRQCRERVWWIASWLWRRSGSSRVARGIWRCAILGRCGPTCLPSMAHLNAQYSWEGLPHADHIPIVWYLKELWAPVWRYWQQCDSHAALKASWQSEET